jgi:hypothetical protein
MARLRRWLQDWLTTPIAVKLRDLERNQTALALEIVLLKQATPPTPDLLPNPATARASKTTETAFEPTMGRL